MGLCAKERYLTVKRALFTKYYGAFLNPEQVKAVLCVKGPLLILAGAGSGKTTVLVNRICHIIKYGDAYETDEVPAGLTDEDVAMLEQAYETLSPMEIEPLLPAFSH
ncbi:MAG: UvrD-helicase domain-containing protein, partial [Clostridia bacterium]|nr:UvrD-helicase domain-containing protein [Clostridia bacterium]